MQVPEPLVPAGILAYPSFVVGNIQPQPGVTEITVRLKPEGERLLPGEYADEIEQNVYNEVGIVSTRGNIYIGASNILEPSESFPEDHKSAFYAAFRSRADGITQRLARLEAAGIPALEQLLRFKTDVRFSESEKTALGEGFTAQNVMLGTQDFGLTVPVAMHPVLFREMQNNQLRLFQLLQTYVEQAAFFVHESPNLDLAESILSEVEKIIGSLTLISPVLRNNLIFAVRRDIEEIRERKEQSDADRAEDAVLIHRSARVTAPLAPSIGRNHKITRILKGAFEDLQRTVNEGFAEEVKNSFSIVVGNRPDKNPPPNTVFLSPNFFDMLMYLAQDEKTIDYASALLARQLFDAYRNRPRLLTNLVLSSVNEGENTPERFLIPVQMTAGEITESFSGQVIMPFDISYDNYGRPVVNMNGSQTITVFRNGVPVQVTDRKNSASDVNLFTGKRVASVFIGDDSRARETVFPLTSDAGILRDIGFRPVRNELGSLIGLEALSDIEHWIGSISPEDTSVYFLSKNGRTVALVKADKETDTIFPLLPSEHLNPLLGTDNDQGALDILRNMASQRRDAIKKAERVELETARTESDGMKKAVT